MSYGYNLNIIGFHGTIKKYAENIIKTKNFKPQLRNDHWLGQGTYFFREDYDQASWWSIMAKRKAMKEGNVTELECLPLVIACDFQVQDDKMLNLDTDSGKGFLKAFYQENQELLDSIQFTKDGELASSDHERRCMIIDLIPIEIIKVVQYTFRKTGDTGYNKESIFLNLGIEQSGIQVCVRDNEIFKGAHISIVKPKKKITYSNHGKKTHGTVKMSITRKR
jgi:hypothetical protein